MDLEPRTLVPHRPPILCIDRILSVTDTAAVAERTVPGSDTVDGNIWEGFLIEGLAQTAAALAGQQDVDAGREPAQGMLVGLRDIEITTRPAAGTTIRYTAELVKQLAPLTLIEGHAVTWPDEKPVMTGGMKFYVEAHG